MFKHLILSLLLLSSTLQSDLKILKTRSGVAHPAPCALTCAGTEHYTSWIDSKIHPGKSYVEVNTRECNFMSRPIFTVSVDGGPGCPSLRITSDRRDFNLMRVYAQEDKSASEMNREFCFVHWSAFGYNC